MNPMTTRRLAAFRTLAHRGPRALAFAAFVAVVFFAQSAWAAGAFKLRSTDVKEVSGAWHIFVTIELPKPPQTAHQPMRFLFTKTAVYERSLVDGKSDPVTNRTVLQNQTPSTESLDVDFADGSGKIFKGTRFDFGLTRARGYEAGEYKVELRTKDGVSVGSPVNLTLRGDNEVVDRRSITFNAKQSGIKKIDGVDAGAKVAQADDPPPVDNGGEVTPTGTATPFVPADAYNRTPEEDIKVKKSGCGCTTPGSSQMPLALSLLPLVGVAALLARRRR
jgi:MYXO-CTERM domain-containing protein